MKKNFYVLLIIVSVLILTSCGSKDDLERSIKVAELSEEENNLVDLLNIDSRNLIYDFKLDETVKTLQLNMYQLKDNNWELFSKDNISFKDESGRMALSFNKIVEGYRIAIQSDANTSSNEQITEMTNNSVGVKTTILNSNKEIIYEEEIPLVIQVLSSEEITDSFEIDSFNQPEIYENEDYNAIYAITVLFSEKSINELDRGIKN